MKKLSLITIALLFLIPSPAHAARLWSSGCEFQGDSPGNMTNNLEWGVAVSAAGTAVINTTIKRSGLSSCRTVGSTDQTAILSETFAAAGTGPFYFRFYFYAESAPSVAETIMSLNAAAAGDLENEIRLNTDMTLQVYDDDATSQGSSSALNTDQWYRIEYYYADAALELLIDGTSVLSAAANDGDTISELELGAPSAGTFDFYFDDVAINNTSNSAQNSWPGAGSIVHMQANAEGDTNNCSAGSTGGSGDVGDVDEVTPDDATSFCELDDNNEIYEVGLESSSSAGIDSYDTVSVVMVGVRSAENPAGTGSGIVSNLVRSATGGTRLQGTNAGTFSNGTYFSHRTAVPYIYSLSTTTDPTTGIAWTPTGTNSLDNMVIGSIATDASPDMAITTIWALVEYVDVALATASAGRPRYLRMGTLLLLQGTLIIN